ncbi:MAG: hypothetical protein Ta2C_06180 [Candidatus Endomicrobiellum trichonymphae]|nr:MAG: hypothetical protein Ta2C_06180 [Candidatus Endomicrobium trichonymphae]
MLNDRDTAFMIICTAFVFIMTPGQPFFTEAWDAGRIW